MMAGKDGERGELVLREQESNSNYKDWRYSMINKKLSIESRLVSGEGDNW